MLNLLKFTSALLFASFVAGQAQQAITAPNSTVWWVAESNNVLTWNCNMPGNKKSFNVLISNPKVFTSALAVISQQEDSQCSKLITTGQVNLAAATGYTILFSNPVNNTDVYVTSQEFEIKPLGAAYPTTTSATSTASGSSPSHTSGSISLTAGLGVVSFAVFAIVALFA